jgi:F-type H+-transporting ATPase subunit b
VLKILDERSSKIAQAQKAAEATLKEKAEIESLQKKAKSDAEKQASAIITEARATADEQSKQIVTEAKKQAKAEVAKLHQQWEEEKARMARAMQQEFNDSVMAVAEKVLANSLDKKAHSKLIDQELKSLIKAA